MAVGTRTARWIAGREGLNIAHEAVDRHASGATGARVAFRFIARSGGTRDITYAELAAATNRFANVLGRLGVGRGDVVVALSGRVLVTTEALYRRKVEPHRGAMPALEHVMLVGESGATTRVPATHDLHALLDGANAAFTIPPTNPTDPALLHFTSGTTGLPKGAIHLHEAVVAHHITGRFALDLHPDDISWCTADPGWVTGTSYGIVAPLTNGITSIVDEGDFDAERWYRILRDEQVSVW